MKNLIYTCIGVIAVLFSSCTEDFEPDFDQNATERYTAQKAEFSAKLQDAEYGWVLQHFPSSDQEYGGYNYYFDFLDNSNIKVSSEGNDVVNQTLTTSYSLKGSSGVYLSLDTYNDIAHELANPSGANYQAFGGEYEFNLLTTNTSNDTINIIGRVTRNKMRLIKLKESWADYNQKVVNNRETMSGAKLLGTLDGIDIEDVNLIDGSLDIPGGGRLGFSIGDNYSEEAFIYTDKGISFYNPITINGIEYKEFIINTETKELVSLDGKIKIKIIKAPINFNNTTWVINLAYAELRSEKVFEAYQTAHDANALKWGEDLLTTMYIGSYRGEKGIHFLSSTGPTGSYRTVYLFDFSGNITNSNYLNINEAGGGTYWDDYYSHLSPFKNIITDNSPYIVEFTNEEKSIAKLTSSEDPDVWFYIFKN